MGARGSVAGEGESGGGRGTSKDHQGFWEVPGGHGKSNVGIETGDGSQAAEGCRRQCEALVKPPDSAARPRI